MGNKLNVIPKWTKTRRRQRSDPMSVPTTLGDPDSIEWPQLKGLQDVAWGMLEPMAPAANKIVFSEDFHCCPVN